jgi:hypothetical protein
MNWLAENHALFCYGAHHSVIDLAKGAFEEATNAVNNPGVENPDCQAEGGSATGAIVAIDRLSDTQGVLHGASIGDAAAISVRLSDERARQLNPVFRKYDRDTGGQITMCMGVDGPVWCFSVEVTSQEFIILATDGLTDNINLPELDRIVPLLMRASLFDVIVPFDCDDLLKEEPQKPTYSSLLLLTKGNLDALSDVSCQTAARRLFHYLEWVTRLHFNMEERYYKASRKVREEQDAALLHALEEEVKGIAAERKRIKKVVKTDDAMIIVMRPFHTNNVH